MANRRLFISDGIIPAVISVSGTTGAINVSGAKSLLVSLFATTLTGGAVSPTIQATVDYLDDDQLTVVSTGVVTTANLTTAPATANVSASAFTGFVIPNWIRLRWIVGQVSGTPEWNGVKLRLWGQP